METERKREEEAKERQRFSDEIKSRTFYILRAEKVLRDTEMNKAWSVFVYK